MPSGLPVTRYIQTSIVLAPNAAQASSTAACMILGDSSVIDIGERFRSYSGLPGVATDFGTSAPEYAAAAVHFGQKPTPTSLMIGRWAQTGPAGLLKGGILTPAQQALANFTAVTSGGFKIQVDAAGSPVNVASINLSGAASLNAVAALITTALTGASVGATCTWNAATGRFYFTSSTTGAASKVQPLQAPTSGTNLATILLGTVALGAVEVDGIAAETAVAALTAVETAAPFFHKLSYATSYAMVVADHVAIATYVEASGVHLYGPTTADTSHLAAGSTTNLGYSLVNGGFTRTAYQYSALTPFAMQSALARLAVVDYTGQNTSITLAFKQEPGVGAETLSTTQANALDGYRANYLVNVNNGTQIVANGWCAGPAWVDVIDGMDALAFGIQGDLYNVLYTNPKIPQTDAGMNQLVGAAEARCQQFVRNGVLAPGVWTGPNIGALKTGDTLADGYYVYAAPVATQSSGQRASRVATVLQIAVKLAGAVQDVPAIINVNQ